MKCKSSRRGAGAQPHSLLFFFSLRHTGPTTEEITLEEYSWEGVLRKIKTKNNPRENRGKNGADLTVYECPRLEQSR